MRPLRRVFNLPYPLLHPFIAGQGGGRRAGGQDIRGAEGLLPTLPAAETLLADKSDDSDRFRAALTHRGISACVPGRVHRKNPIASAPDLYKHRNRIERMFGRLKDWRRRATRYGCAHPFFPFPHYP